MTILVSPTAYKGTLTPSQAAQITARAVRKAVPSAKITILPLADGGDGTLDVLKSALRGKSLFTRVRGPLGKPIRAEWALLPGRTAVIEMARASGLALTGGKNRVMEATSYGTGQLIKAALDRGCKKIYIGVGGTACAEGGAGALRALGLRYFSKNGRELSEKPSELLRLHHVDWENFDARLKKTAIHVLCDVRNPLLGKNGSARTYAPQKGATPSQVRTLEKFLAHWSRFARKNVKAKPGAGAAGALAFGLAGFAGARLNRGTEFILKTLKWEQAAKNTAVILTGEGKIDETSFSGKVVGEVTRYRGRAKVYAVCGSTPFSHKQWKKCGIAGLEEMGKAGLKNPKAALSRGVSAVLQKMNTRI